MKVLIKQATIIHAGSAHHGLVKDVLVANGIIQQISDNIEATADEVFEHENLHVSIGWMDIFAHFNDPGLEQKETLETGAAAAAAGGFTELMLLPNTQPAVSTKSIVEYIRQKALALPVSIHPIAAITKNTEGKELTEMYDMHASGAIAYSDGTQSVQSPGVLLKALQYVLPVNGTIIQVPDDKSISAHGLMNEGIASTRLGLPGKPAIAEELMIARDIELLKYTSSKLHITGVSTKKGIDLIQAAKASGLAITCSVSPAHLLFCDEGLAAYDTNLKLNPPLRTSADRQALQEALADGSIDCIASHHFPQHWDDKTCEFEYAKYGSISLEALAGVAGIFIDDVEQLVELLSIRPRNIFNLPIPELQEAAPANLTLFLPGHTYTFQQEHIASRSNNCAFTGQTLKGKVVATIHKNQLSYRKP